MYSSKIISANLAQFARDNGWEPTYHSIADVKDFNLYLESITVTDANSRNYRINLSKGLTQRRIDEIRRWIQNEQVLCSLDSGYFENHYAYICDEKGEIFQFRNRRSQEVFDAVIADFDELQVAIELLIIKGRQVGITTKTALKFLHRMLFVPNTQSVMASVQAEKSELISRILNTCYERCPWWLIPGRNVNRIGKMMGWDNHSVLSIQSGMQPTGIAQGWTPVNIHISELADIPNPQKVLEEGLLRATHSSRKLFQVWEGTGGGSTGYLADKWRSCKEDWPLGKSRFCPLFLSWPLATDLYPEADWIKKFPIPARWTPSPETVKHVRRCELYIRSTPHLAKVCGPRWSMPLDQQWFWEFNYLEAVKSHTQKIWLSQMPADDYEALTGKNDLVFDQDVIEVQSHDRKREYTAYAVTGHSIDEGFEPDDSIIDYDLPRIHVQWDSHRGQHYDWTLIPLLPFDESREQNSLDKIIIYEEPREGQDYSIGIDTADGLGKEDEDRSVCNVTLSAKGENPDIQAAEFVSNRVNPPQMVGFAACLAAWYGPFCREARGVKFIIEQRERPGDDCQLQLKLMGFTYHHIMDRYDSKVIREGSGYKQGFYTNTWSRPMLLNRFVDSIINGWYKPNSKWLIEELRSFERRVTPAGKTRLEHQAGKHDDRIFAAALAYFTRHHYDVMADRSQKRYARPSQKNPDIDYSRSCYNSVAVGEW